MAAVGSEKVALSNGACSSPAIVISGSTGVNIGMIITVQSPGPAATAQPQKAATSAQPNTRPDCIYKKTPTVKEMLLSKEQISPGFLDHLAGNFGERWREITIQLKIDQLFVDRMFVDHFDRAGSKEVLYQILKAHFRKHPSQSTVGWFTSFLWTNGFKETVSASKEVYIQLKEIESFGNSDSETSNEGDN